MMLTMLGLRENVKGPLTSSEKYVIITNQKGNTESFSCYNIDITIIVTIIVTFIY
jgi:hypothetical protein